MDEQKKQTIFDPAKVIAIGIASPAATLLTSRFGIAGTLLGLALGAMILTAVADFLKVYLARTSHAAAHAAVTKVPGAMKAPRGFLPGRLFRRKGRVRQKAPYRGYSSPPPSRWRQRSLLVGRSVVAAGISFLLGLGAITAIEHSAGKSLSCWVWEECPVESSADEDGGSSDTSTQLSIFGGGPSAGSGAAAPRVRPADPQQRLTPKSGTPETPSSQTPSKTVDSEGSDSGAGNQWQEQSDQQQDSYYYYSEEYEQQSSSSPSSTEEAQRGEYRDGGSADWRDETTSEYEVPSLPWIT